jgi:hypothetical protein
MLMADSGKSALADEIGLQDSVGMIEQPGAANERVSRSRDTTKNRPSPPYDVGNGTTTALQTA